MNLTANNKFLTIPSSIDYYVPEWVNIDWTSFSSSGSSITSMIDDSSILNRKANTTPVFILNAGDKYYFKYWVTLNTGSHPNNSPYFALMRQGNIAMDLTMNPAFNGYEYSFTAYLSGNYYFTIGNQFKVINASANFQFYKKTPLTYLTG